MEKILVPIDGSETSVKAAQVAIDLAEKFGSEVTLLTVTFIPDEVYNFYLRTNYEQLSVLAEAYADNNQKMLASVEDQIDAKGVKISKKVVPGINHEAIVDEAEKGNFDLIVIGRRGLSRIKRLFIGSVTERVLNQAPCSVYVVKE